MSEELPDLIDEVVVATESEYEKVMQNIVATQEPAEIALLLESLPLAQRVAAWEKIKADQRLAILVEMRGDPRESLLDEMSITELDGLFADISSEDLLELADSLPNRLIDRALNAMDEQQRGYFQDAQQYDDDTAGHWVNRELLSLPLNAKVRDGLRLLRRKLPDYTDTIFLLNRAGHFSEAVRVSAIIGAPDHVHLVDLSEETFPLILDTDDALAAAKKVQGSGFTALPVVNDHDLLIGRFHIGNACEIVNESFESQVMASAGLDEDEDLFSPVTKSAKNRALWLGINLLTAFLASWFIGLFEATLQQAVALAVLMPVVASMGGIAGSQTLTLIVRGLAMGQVTKANRQALLKKELQVGGLNGAVWAVVIGIVAAIWFDMPALGFVIGLAILVNIVSAALSGVVIPVMLDKMKLDPALSGSVVLTTVTDIVGFVAFLGLGTLVLL